MRFCTISQVNMKVSMNENMTLFRVTAGLCGVLVIAPENADFVSKLQNRRLSTLFQVFIF